MRIFPTKVQRQYLDEIASFVFPPSTPDAPSKESKAISTSASISTSPHPTTSPQSHPWLSWLPAAGQQMLAKVPRKVIVAAIILATLGLSRYAFGSEMPAPSSGPTTIEHPVAVEPAPANPDPGQPQSDAVDLVPILLGASTAALGVAATVLMLLLMRKPARRNRHREVATHIVERGETESPELVPAETDVEPINDEPPAELPPLDSEWRLGFATHRGPVRRSNEDAGCAFAIGTHQVLVLADGVGGMKHGGDAARIAVRAAERAIRQSWRATPPDQEPLPELMLSNAFAAAAARLAASGVARGFGSIADGLRTTLIVVIGTADHFHFSSIGDGGMNLVRADGTVRTLFVPQKADPDVPNVLSASLGPVPQGNAVVGRAERHPTDLLVVSTDGIADRVSPTFYSRTLLRQAHRNRGDLALTAEGVLDYLSRYRDDDGIFAFDDNMTLALMGDGSALPDPEQAPTSEFQPAEAN